MKRRLTLVAACILVMNLVAGSCLAAVGSEAALPQYDLTRKTAATLNISSNGTAECRIYVKSVTSADTIDMRMELLVKKGRQWDPYKYWVFTGAKGIIDQTRMCIVESGTYKLKITGTVTTTTGKTEAIIFYSDEKTYTG